MVKNLSLFNTMMYTLLFKLIIGDIYNETEDKFINDQKAFFYKETNNNLNIKDDEIYNNDFIIRDWIEDYDLIDSSLSLKMNDSSIMNLSIDRGREEKKKSDNNEGNSTSYDICLFDNNKNFFYYEIEKSILYENMVSLIYDLFHTDIMKKIEAVIEKILNYSLGKENTLSRIIEIEDIFSFDFEVIQNLIKKFEINNTNLEEYKNNIYNYINEILDVRIKNYLDEIEKIEKIEKIYEEKINNINSNLQQEIFNIEELFNNNESFSISNNSDNCSHHNKLEYYLFYQKNMNYDNVILFLIMPIIILFIEIYYFFIKKVLLSVISLENCVLRCYIYIRYIFAYFLSEYGIGKISFLLFLIFIFFRLFIIQGNIREKKIIFTCFSIVYIAYILLICFNFCFEIVTYLILITQIICDRNACPFSLIFLACFSQLFLRNISKKESIIIILLHILLLLIIINLRLYDLRGKKRKKNKSNYMRIKLIY